MIMSSDVLPTQPNTRYEYNVDLYATPLILYGLVGSAPMIPCKV